MIHYAAVHLDVTCCVSILIVIIVWRVIRLLLLSAFVCVCVCVEAVHSV